MKHKIVPYKGTQLEFFPGDTILTSSGTATVTRTDQAGEKTIIFADYGSGFEQPHIDEGIDLHIVPHRCREAGYPLERDRQREQKRAIVPRQQIQSISPNGWIVTQEGMHLNPLHYQAEPEQAAMTEAVLGDKLETQSNPLERQAEALHDTLAALEIERERIKAEGAIAPDYCWIETGKVKGRNFRQAWWRSDRPLFPAKRSKGNEEAKVKSQYIGAEGSPQHREAIAAKERRDRLRAIERQIQRLMEGV